MTFKRTHDIYKLNKFKAPQRLKSTELDLKVTGIWSRNSVDFKNVSRELKFFNDRLTLTTVEKANKMFILFDIKILSIYEVYKL